MESSSSSTVVNKCGRCGKKVPENGKVPHDSRCLRTTSSVAGSEVTPLLSDPRAFAYDDPEDDEPPLYLNENGICRYCHQSIPESEVSTHLGVCPEVIEICNSCYNLVHTKNMKHHKEGGHKRHVIGPAFAARDRMMGVTYTPFGMNLPTLTKLAPYLIFLALIAIIGVLSSLLLNNGDSPPVPADFHP